MKVAIASDIYAPMMNGVAVFAHNLATGLARAGHEVMVICPSFNGKYAREVDENGVQIVHLASARFPFYPDQITKVPERKALMGLPMPRLAYRHGIWFAINPYPELKKALDEFQPDVVHLQTAETIAVATLHYVRKYDVPLVSTGHAYPDNVTGQFKMLKPVKKPLDAMLRTYMASFLKHAEYATMPTEMAIGDLVPKNRKRFKVTVEALSNGVDLSAFKPGAADEAVLRRYGLEPGRTRALYVGRVDPEKSIEKVIRAFAQMVADGTEGLAPAAAKRLKEAELVVVGDGTQLSELKNLAHELGLDGGAGGVASGDGSGATSGDGAGAKRGARVKFLGKVLPPDLIEIYRSGVLFATASETETQGIVLIEAAAVGLPLIAVDAGAVGEVCRDGENGALCRPGDVDGIAAAMRQILGDARLQRRYAKRSLEIAQRHDLQRTLGRFVEIYEEAVKLKRG